MKEPDKVNEKLGEWFNSFEDGANALVEFSSQFISQDWLMFIGILLALVLFGVMGLRNS